MMSKCDTIDAILKCNPSARPEFLSGFSNDDLVRYLDRLRETRRQRPYDSATGTIALSDPPPARRAG